jgi:hypothetical protein
MRQEKTIRSSTCGQGGASPGARPKVSAGSIKTGLSLRRYPVLKKTGVPEFFPAHQQMIKKNYSFLFTTNASRTTPIAAMMVAIPTGDFVWIG